MGTKACRLEAHKWESTLHNICSWGFPYWTPNQMWVLNPFHLGGPLSGDGIKIEHISLDVMGVAGGYRQS